MEFETILPFLRPIASLLTDPTISEIMINPGSAVFIERSGGASGCRVWRSVRHNSGPPS
jgi:Flp pilus assembly CpaF family ATPase